MSPEILLMNLGAAGLVLHIFMRRWHKAKRKPMPSWSPLISTCSIMLWGLGLVLLILNRLR